MLVSVVQAASESLVCGPTAAGVMSVVCAVIGNLWWPMICASTDCKEEGDFICYYIDDYRCTEREQHGRLLWHPAPKQTAQTGSLQRELLKSVMETLKGSSQQLKTPGRGMGRKRLRSL